MLDLPDDLYEGVVVRIREDRGDVRKDVRINFQALALGGNGKDEERRRRRRLA